MSALLTNLFPRRRNRTQSRVSAPKRRVRLGVESLGERIVPAVTGTLADGVLTITGAANKDNDVQVFLWTEQDGTKETVVFDRIANEKTYYRSSKINKLVMNGGSGKDILQNDTYLPSTLNGGNGKDTLIGGYGSDIFQGSAGLDSYTGRGGQDVLYRNGFHGVIADTNDRLTDYDLTVGEVSIYDSANPARGLSANELSAQGSITVSQDPLNANRLILNGPSGAAVVLKSNWSLNIATQSFETSGAVKLETPSGDVTLSPAVSGIKTQVRLYGSPVQDAGNLHDITWAGQAATRGANPLQDMLNDLTSPLGVELSIPKVNWGIGLGSQVKDLDDSAPLNDAVPYLYARFDTGLSIKSSNAAISLIGGRSATLAYAPSDGTQYVSVGDTGFAVSPFGYIPYEPTGLPEGVEDPSIWGHVYVRGTIPLTSSLSVDGSIVLGLDYNADGNSSLLNADSLTKSFEAFASISSGSGLNKAAKSALAALDDTAIGFKGKLNIGFKDVVTLELGSASAWYKPGQVAFVADSSNPFEGLGVLEQLGKTSFHVEGVCNWTVGSPSTTSWSLDATAATASFGGLTGTDIVFEAGSDKNAIEVSASYNVPVLGTLDATGKIGFDGSFKMDGALVVSRHTDKEHSWSHTDVTTTISIGYQNQAFTFAGHFNATGSYGEDVLGAVGFSVDLELEVDIVPPTTYYYDGQAYPLPGGIYISAAGYIEGWVNPFWAGVIDARIGFAFDNDSFTLDLPLIGDVTIDW